MRKHEKNKFSKSGLHRNVPRWQFSVSNYLLQGKADQKIDLENKNDGNIQSFYLRGVWILVKIIIASRYNSDNLRFFFEICNGSFAL